MSLFWRRYTPVQYAKTEDGLWYAPWPDDPAEPRLSFVQARKRTQPDPYTGVRYVWEHLPNGNWRMVEAPLSRKAAHRLREFQCRRPIELMPYLADLLLQSARNTL